MQRGSITGVPGVSTDEIAQVMSAQLTPDAIVVSGGAIGSVAGGQLNVSIPDDSALTLDDLVSVTGGSVHGTNSESRILANHTQDVAPPEFPYVDTDPFRAYATTPYATGMTVLKNVLIPAGTNPQFTSAVTIQGILFVESPNTLAFRGNTLLQGFIVFADGGSPSVNVIDQRGNFTHEPLPTGAEFDSLRATTGIAVLAPTGAMTLSGNAGSTLKGNVIVGTFNNEGSSDVTIERGSLMTLDETTDSTIFNGRNVRFASTGAPTLPDGVLTYSSYFQPDPKSYQEVAP